MPYKLSNKLTTVAITVVTLPLIAVGFAAFIIVESVQIGWALGYRTSRWMVDY